LLILTGFDFSSAVSIFSICISTFAGSSITGVIFSTTGRGFARMFTTFSSVLH